MPRLASLFLPDLAIERIRRAERTASRPERRIKVPPLDGEDGQVRIAPRSEALSGGQGGLAMGWGGLGDSLRGGGGVHPHPTLPHQGGGLSRDCSCPRGGGWRPGARWAREEPPPRPPTRPDGAGALVTAHRVGNRDLLAAVASEARRLGLAPGLPLATARVLVPGLDVRPADHQGDAAWLARLGLFAARRWTPRAALSGPDGLWLDLTGVTHLFGGEQRMSERILAFCRRLGFSARIAIAGTAGAAYALARFGAVPLIRCPKRGEAEAIAPLPLAALRLGEETLGAARRLGLERVGDLLAMPRAPLQRRFGGDLLRRLDQALGRAAEPIEPIVPAQPPSVTLRFIEPIATAEAIAEAAGEAVRRLVPRLAEAGLGLRRLVMICDRVDNIEQYLTVNLSRQSRDGAHLRQLLCAKIETIEPGFGIERLRLVAARVEPLAPAPVESELTGPAPTCDIVPLIDRLAARLGTRRLYRLGALESDLPERSVSALAPLAAPADWPSWPRPVRLLSPPEPVEQVMSVLPDAPPRRFVWRGRAHRVAAADGPERLYGEWWRRTGEQATVRDYFQVEDEDGKRFWLFRQGDGESAATGDMSWHMHGVFA